MPQALGGYKLFLCFVTTWPVVLQAPLCMGFSRQEYWSRLPFHSPDLPDPGTEPVSPALAGEFFIIEPPGKPSEEQKWDLNPGNVMKVKEESEKVGLKLNIQKTKIMASGPITYGK